MQTTLIILAAITIAGLFVAWRIVRAGAQHDLDNSPAADQVAVLKDALREAERQRDALLSDLIGMCGAMQKAMPHLPADHEAIYCGEWFAAAQETIASVRGAA